MKKPKLMRPNRAMPEAAVGTCSPAKPGEVSLTFGFKRDSERDEKCKPLDLRAFHKGHLSQVQLDVRLKTFPGELPGRAHEVGTRIEDWDA